MVKGLLQSLRRLRDEAHVVTAVNIGRPNSSTQVVSVMTQDHDGRLSDAEVENQDGEPLPERTQMSLIDPGIGFTTPIDPPAGYTLPVEPPVSE